VRHDPHTRSASIHEPPFPLAIMISAIEAKQASDAISDNDEAWSGSLLDRYDEGQSAETRMFVLSGVGAAALAGGAILYYLGWRAGRAEDVTVGAARAEGGASVTVGGTW